MSCRAVPCILRGVSGGGGGRNRGRDFMPANDAPVENRLAEKQRKAKSGVPQEWPTAEKKSSLTKRRFHKLKQGRGDSLGFPWGREVAGKGRQGVASRRVARLEGLRAGTQTESVEKSRVPVTVVAAA